MVLSGPRIPSFELGSPDITYDELQKKLIQGYGTDDQVAEAQDELAQLCLGDRTFKQLPLRVQHLVSEALPGTSKTVQEAHGVHPFLQALSQELSRETSARETGRWLRCEQKLHNNRSSCSMTRLAVEPSRTVRDVWPC